MQHHFVLLAEMSCTVLAYIANKSYMCAIVTPVHLSMSTSGYVYFEVWP